MSRRDAQAGHFSTSADACEVEPSGNLRLIGEEDQARLSFNMIDRVATFGSRTSDFKLQENELLMPLQMLRLPQ